MKLVLDHIVSVPPDVVLATFTDPAFLAGLGELGAISAPNLLSQERGATTVHQRVRYHFAGDLSPVALAAVDPAKLAWVDDHVYDVPGRRSTFTIEPDNYGDRFEASGREQFLPVSEGTAWHVEVALHVRWPVVGTLVEKAIASGLRDALAAEVALIERFSSP